MEGQTHYSIEMVKQINNCQTPRDTLSQNVRKQVYLPLVLRTNRRNDSSIYLTPREYLYLRLLKQSGNRKQQREELSC